MYCDGWLLRPSVRSLSNVFVISAPFSDPFVLEWCGDCVPSQEDMCPLLTGDKVSFLRTDRVLMKAKKPQHGKFMFHSFLHVRRIQNVRCFRRSQQHRNEGLAEEAKFLISG